MADFFAAVPWLVLLVVFVGEKLQQFFVIRALDRALERAQGPAAPPPPSPPAVDGLPQPKPLAPAPPADLVKPAPKAAGPFAASPAWFTGALHEIGFHETGNNGGIGRYTALAHCGAEGDPWCAIFANAMLEQSGVAGSRSASSQSFRSNPGFVQLSGPALGAIVVFWRNSQASGLGHVGFYRGEDSSRIWTLGGNENDMVQIEALPKAAATFGLVGYWWPKSVLLPAVGAVLMPSGSPLNVQVAPSSPPSSTAAASGAAATPGLQSNIVATQFGGPQSAYGGPIDDNSPGVALPFRFKGARPQVRITGKNSGVTITCDIVDVGPWNINDPYWTTGSRPQSETGTDMTGRHTNKAGIDLTLAAATQLKIDGKGLVDWEFVQSPLPNPPPNVI